MDVSPFAICRLALLGPRAGSCLTSELASRSFSLVEASTELAKAAEPVGL